MPDYPPEIRDAAVRAAEAESEIGYSTPPEIMADAVLDAIAPLLGDYVARKILAHMEAHGPKPSPGEFLAANRWRRHFRIAAQVASRAFLTEEDLKRIVAQALAAGNYVGV